MSNLEIVQVTTKKDLKKFVTFPNRLYKGNPYYVPQLTFDEVNTLRKDKNPAFAFCEAEYWLAVRDGKVVGRVAGIINPVEVQKWGVQMVRFGWIDFIDDYEVSNALIDSVIEWGKSKGMTGIHGPLGFNDMDAEGMLIEGFDEISSLSAIYNYPYYRDHMEKLGFGKATDFIQFEVKVPEEIPEKIERLTRIVLQKYDLRLLKASKASEIRPYAQKMFTMYNAAFEDLYGFTALSQKQMDYYTKMYFDFIRPEFVSLVIDSKDDIVGFGITMPSLALALQKAKGKLFPFGFYHILRAIRKNDIIHMYLVGVREDYQGKGILALVYHELTKAYIEHGIKIARTHPQLEENLRAVSIWKNYDSRIYIRRRIYTKDI
jgi:hypothetical protein